jgi:spermidine synthase
MLETVVFICGAAVMILEMLGSRILAPYVGTSIIVWTSLIGIILGCLSYGYWWGGKLADLRPSYRALSFIILLSGICVAALALSKSFILGFLQQHTGSIYLVSTLATLILFAPPSTLLGMVSPYAVRLKMNDLQTSGATVGRLYAISTVGSIFGTFFAGFFLIAFIGTTNALIIIAALLVATSLLTSLQDRRAKIGAAAACITLLIGSTAYDGYLAGQGLFDVDTDYNRLLIYKTNSLESGRNMQVMVTSPHGQQSAMYLDNSTELALAYTKFYKLARHFKPDMKKTVMLGGGGYSFPKYAMANYPDMEMHVVEIDPHVTKLAARFFELREHPRLKVYHEDARTFLNRTNTQYDIVFGDTFTSHYSIPFHLSTIETVRMIYKSLVDGGVVLTNVLCAIEGDAGRFMRAEYATFKAVFPQVYLFPVEYSEDGLRRQNIMLVALKSNETPSFVSDDQELQAMLGQLWTKPIPTDLPPLSDDFAPVDHYVTAMQ